MQGLTIAMALLLTQQNTADKPLQGEAAKCGSEIPWILSLTDAQKQSKATGRPILW